MSKIDQSCYDTMLRIIEKNCGEKNSISMLSTMIQFIEKN